MSAFGINLRWMVFSLLSTVCFTSLAGAAPDTSLDQSARGAEIGRLRAKLYQRVDYPLLVRQLRTDITLGEARVASLRRRVKEANRFVKSNALFTTRERLNLELLAAELAVKDLKHELNLLRLYNQDERRLRQLLQAPMVAYPSR